MTVHEILVRKRYLDSKLATINKYINSINTSTLHNADQLLTDIIKDKFDIISKLRSHRIILDKLNNNTKINIDGIELSIYEALHLLDSLKLKMATFSNILESNVATTSIDVLGILNKNDSLFEEYQKVYIAVRLSDTTTSWEKE
jgi:hypothetical protein